MNKPIIQVRKFYDGTWSVMARIFNPQKGFYEHPNFINLSEEDATNYCNQIIQNKPSVEEIKSNWTYIGD